MKQKVEISKHENSSRDGEDKPANMGRNLDVINVEMEKNEKGKKKLHQSESSVSLEATKVLGDGQEVSLGRELVDENITHKLKCRSKERKKEKKRHKVAHDAASLDSISELHGDRSNMIEGNHDKIESQSKERKKVKKKHKVIEEGASLVTMSELHGDRSNMIEGEHDNMAPAEGSERKLKVDAFKAKGRNIDENKRKKQKRDKDSDQVMEINSNISGNEAETLEGHFDERIMAELEYPRKERKKRKKDLNFDAILGNESTKIGKNGGEGNSTKRVEIDAEMEDHSTESEGEYKVKKKLESARNDSKEKGHGEAQRARNLSEKSTPKGKSKCVSFADDVEVEVFSPFDGMDDEEAGQEEGQVRGKRFSLEEDDILKEAVLNYISSHNLGGRGLDMVLHCKEYPEIKDCWKEIGAAVPWRPRSSVYYRAHILFERDESRSWSKDERDFVCMFHEKYGPDWKTLANILGKQRIHVKDLWRRTNLPDRKKGKWSQEEYQALFDLVNLDLRMKASQEKKFKHGMLRDNIPWTAISQKLQTRTVETCCTKWYRQLTSPMVAEGKWFDTDDYRLLKALYDLDACCMEDVDWDDLLEHRSGVICRQRWNQMIKHLGEHGNKTFSEQVEILTHRYRPELLEAREAYDNKPAFP